MVAGAVYRPEELIEPAPAGLTDHVTALLEALVTVAVSCAAWAPFNAVVAGVTFTATEGAVPFRAIAGTDGDVLGLIVMTAV